LDLVQHETGRLRADEDEARSIRRRLEASVLRFFDSGRNPDALSLAYIIRDIGTLQAREFLSDWYDFKIVFAEGPALDRMTSQNGLSGKADAFFVPPKNGKTKGKFLIRSFPRFDTRTEEGRNAAFAEIVNRLIDLFHEWRHGRDALKEGIFTTWDRHERIVFEVRALLEEHLFRVSIGEENFERTARQMGDPLITFLIHFSDWLYP